MIFVGIILLLVAVGFFYAARSQEGRLNAIGATETYTTALLSEIHTRVSSVVGTNAMAEKCEIAGVIECDTPLRGQISGTQCVAYTYNITREYEEQVTRTNSEGKMETVTERGSETIESADRRTTFWVRDDTGRVMVDPDGAELDLVSTASRFEGANDPGFSRRRNLGTRFSEEALPVGARVFILGCAIDRQGLLMIGRSPNNDQFIISRKTERELMQEATGSVKTYKIISAVSGVFGLILLAWSLIAG